MNHIMQRVLLYDSFGYCGVDDEAFNTFDAIETVNELLTRVSFLLSSTVFFRTSSFWLTQA